MDLSIVSKKQDINVVPELKGNIFTHMNSSVVCLFLGLNGTFHGAITNKFLLYAFPNENLVAYISYNTNNGAVAALTIPGSKLPDLRTVNLCQ